jgi:hypothetical protein
MDGRRREILQGLLGAAFVLPAAAAQTPFGIPRSRQDPNGPELPDNETPGVTPKIDTMKILKHNQTQIQQDIDRLYSLAGELKKQVDKTDSSEVLSLELLQKADEVEKLAHQIKSLAKG